jgi:O-antigen/teichoic acid export membrane protein
MYNLGLSSVKTYIGILQDTFYRVSWRKAGHEALWVFVGQAGMAIGGLIGVKLLTHVLIPAEYGKLALANTIVALIGTNLFGPFGQGLARYWSINKDRGNLDVFYAISNRFAKYISLVALLISAVAVIVTMCIVHKFHWVILVAISLVIGIIGGFLSLRIGVFTAARQRRRAAILNISNTLLRPLIAAVLAVMTIANANMALVGYLIAELLVVLIAERLYSHNVSEASLSHLRSNTEKSFSGGLAKEILSYSWPFLIWGIFGWIHVSCDRWALQAFWGSEVVGAFAVVSLLAIYPLVFGSGFLTTLLTPIAFQRAGALTNKDSMSYANRILIVMTAIYILGAVVLIGFFSMFHQPLILLISNVRFARFSYLLPWLTLAWAFFYFGQVTSSFGLLANQPRRYIAPKLISALVAGSSTFYLSNKVGPIGVVWGLGIAGVIYASWCGIIALRLYSEKEYHQ